MLKTRRDGYKHARRDMPGAFPYLVGRIVQTLYMYTR